MFIMKKFFELGNRYARQSDWKDFALTKVCLCAMGVLIGLCIPSKNKKSIGIVAAIIFVISYISLMCKVFKIGKEMINR